MSMAQDDVTPLPNWSHLVILRSLLLEPGLSVATPSHANDVARLYDELLASGGARRA